MPLANYGVLLGAKANYYRDTPNNQGKYMHGHIDVQTPGGLYHTAIDVDVSANNVQIERRVIPLRVGEWSDVFSLSDGFHALASSESSGATDYVRDHRLKNLIFIPEYVAGPVPWWKRIGEAWNVLAGRPGLSVSHVAIGPPALNRREVLQPSHLAPAAAETVAARVQLLTHGVMQARMLARRLRVIDLTPPWQTGSDLDALGDLEAMLTDAPRVVVFGQKYAAQGAKPPGLHNIHQNQGDPLGSQWYPDNGIWQDGLTIAIHSDGTASAFMNKFSTQAHQTDSQGHPL